MIRKHRCRILCLVLCAGLLLGLLPGTAQAAGRSIGADEFGDLTFTTFEDLKALAALSYDYYTYAVYQGEEPLTVGEDLYLPPELELMVWQELVVPAGVTLDVYELYCSALTVEGTLTCREYLNVTDSLSVLGKLENHGTVSLTQDTALTGMDKLLPGDTAARVTVTAEVSNVQALSNAVKEAGLLREGWYYDITLARYGSDTLTDLVLSENLKIPENTELKLLEGIRLTVSPGCTVTLESELLLCGPLRVEGTLVNLGSVDVQYDVGGVLEVTDTGSYSGTGELWIESAVLESPDPALPGLDPMTFAMALYTQTHSRYWAMHLRESFDATAVRIFGNNRYDTALRAADYLKSVLGVGMFDAVIVASGTGFADALSGSYLASKKDAPILLTNGNNLQALTAYIQENLIPGGTVYLLGGTKAVPEALEAQLKDFAVKRLGGATRYDTNLAILQEAGASAGEIIICTGKGFADSLSASALGRPILLVKDSLTEQQKQYLHSASGSSIVIIGGTGAVSQALEAELSTYAGVERLGGADRYETSSLVARRFFQYPGMAVLAYGNKFPDGLCGGPLASAFGVPLLLTATGKSSAAAAYTVETGIFAACVLGGTGLIGDDTVKGLLQMRPEQTVETVN